ncbi:MAG: M23 family metallopeptidase [Ignavibacteriales bacterium]|nr:M23 family metallopeptidase [Ignavibacteriales bacterium]
MPSEREHHKSKKKLYSIVVVPGEDAEPKTFRFTRLRAFGVGLLVLAAFFGSVLALVVYTKLGALLPITNPELENRYNRELIALYNEVAHMKEQLLEIGSYNVKLRKALGENVALTDTGVVRLDKPRTNEPQTSRIAEKAEQVVRQYEQRVLEFSSQQVVDKTQQGVKTRVNLPAILPTEGYITRSYEPAQRHFGLDIAAKSGTLVNAAADGFVVFSGWTHDDGYLVMVSHSNGFLTFYKHNKSLLKALNTFVKRGEPIALLGNSGRTSSGPHLHFEIWKDGTPVDPSLYVLNLNL